MAGKYRFGTFDVDVVTRELRKSGLRVRLDAKAFELLLAFLERPGELLGREELCVRLWPSTHVEFERSLNNAINRLRAALGDSGNAPRFIETLPRRGYRFMATVQQTEALSPQLARPSYVPVRFWAVAAASCVLLLTALVAAYFLREARPTQARNALPASCLDSDTFLHRTDPESLQLTHRALRECVTSLPHYANGRTLLAMSYNRLGAAGLLDPDTAYAAAISEAEQALALDSNQALAYMARGVARLRRDWNWQAAERDHLQAIRLAPEQSLPHHSYALLLSASGRHEQALHEIGEAQRLAPTHRGIATDRGLILYLARRYDEAETQLRSRLEVAPDDAVARHYLADVLLEQRRYAAAADEFEKWLELVGVDAGERTQAAAVMARAGLAGMARRALSNGKQRNAPAFGKALKLATWHASLGERRAALALLNRARAEHDARLIFVAVDPKFDPLRRDPRFGELLKSVGLAL
ncbi:MAG: winged helix-turn-helix domain-containing protein [Acidobacteriales bacterium]|nr:winged helix-turn-helix domain-containing protein [Terriglobales bacterium]